MIFEAQSHFDLAWSPRSHYLEDNLVYVGTLYAPLVCKRVEVTESQFYPPSDFEWTLDPWDRRSRLARVSSVFRPYAPQVKASANLVTSIPLPLGSTIQVNAGWESRPEIVAGNGISKLELRRDQADFYEFRQQLSTKLPAV